jgi:glycosyltransferase involved in cell wall biosynthesis
VEAGMHPSRVYVAYTAVDPTFAAVAAAAEPEHRFRGVSVLFAGTPERRKGIDTVVAASRGVDPSTATWTIAGDWSSELHELRHQIPDHVDVLPKLPRLELAARLAQNAVFLFPSLAEGSARVVAEALVAGCWVITTAETGSVVRDGVDGVLVEPGDLEGILAAIREYEALSPEERLDRSLATRAYAAARLSERRYLEDVEAAYEAVLGRFGR